MTIAIRQLVTHEDMYLIQDLEKEIWGMDPIPIHQTYTAVTNGGLLLGAFDGDRIVGFSYSFAGFANGKVHLCSHMLGTHPDYQSMGVGKLLKEEQLRLARDMGYELIVWTFDPLESRNAYLNVSKLYGICNTYLENWYGEMADGLNKGLPSDRFKIEWWVSSERVQKQWTPEIAHYDRPFAVKQSVLDNPMIEVELADIPTNREGIEVPVPASIQLIKKSEPELALDWRMKIRVICQTLFGTGYALVGVNRSDEGVHYYQFVKRDTIPLNTKHEEHAK